jgi:hypothetical protein
MFYCDRPKYFPMKPEQVAKLHDGQNAQIYNGITLSPKDRQEYENSLKIK